MKYTNSIINTNIMFDRTSADSLLSYLDLSTLKVMNFLSVALVETNTHHYQIHLHLKQGGKYRVTWGSGPTDLVMSGAGQRSAQEANNLSIAENVYHIDDIDIDDYSNIHVFDVTQHPNIAEMITMFLAGGSNIATRPT